MRLSSQPQFYHQSLDMDIKRSFPINAWVIVNLVSSFFVFGSLGCVIFFRMVSVWDRPFKTLACLRGGGV